MTTKTKTIDLQQVLAKNATKPGEYEYRIVKLTNSVEFHTGDMLNRHQVEGLCKAKDWKVNVT